MERQRHRQPHAHRRTAFVFAAALVAFDVASYVYLVRASDDFILNRRIGAIPTYTLGEVVSWRQVTPGLLAGWSRPEAYGTFTVGPKSTLAVRLRERPSADLALIAKAKGVVDPVRLPARDVLVAVNGSGVAQWRFASAEVAEHSARIPRSLVTDDLIVHVEFRVPDHRSPQAIGSGADTRPIGMLLIEWRIRTEALNAQATP